MGKHLKAGLPPGTLLYTGPPRGAKVTINLFDYDANELIEKEVTVEECAAYKRKKSVTWINVNGIHDVRIVEELGKQYDLHPLLLEDVVSTQQRPKVEEYDNCTFLVLRMLRYEHNHLTGEQMSIVLGKNYVISFQETQGDVFDRIRNRIRKQGSRTRRSGPDYLAYALLDAIIDEYFVILERIGEQVEHLNTQLLRGPETSHLKRIQDFKRQAILLRRSIWPLRDAIRTLEHTDSPLISKPTKPYLRDAHDHTIQVIDSIETLRDTMGTMLDLYMSSVSNRMNEVMKVLTIIATIFIPLTFITGVYGMNFEHMPELAVPWAYAAVWSVMLAVVLGMLVYFRRKRWI